MFTRLMQFVLRLTTTRYTRALEDELIRLRAENRALINSVLGIAGIAPLRLDAEIARATRVAAHAHATPNSSRLVPQRRRNGDVSYTAPADSTVAHVPAAASAATREGFASPAPSAASSPENARPHPAILPAPPLRRRSWQQIGRILEITDARRKP